MKQMKKIMFARHGMKTPYSPLLGKATRKKKKKKKSFKETHPPRPKKPNHQTTIDRKKEKKHTRAQTNSLKEPKKPRKRRRNAKKGGDIASSRSGSVGADGEVYGVVWYDRRGRWKGMGGERITREGKGITGIFYPYRRRYRKEGRRKKTPLLKSPSPPPWIGKLNFLKSFLIFFFAIQYHILINSSLTALGVCTPDSVMSAVMSSGGVKSTG